MNNRRALKYLHVVALASLFVLFRSAVSYAESPGSTESGAIPPAGVPAEIATIGEPSAATPAAPAEAPDARMLSAGLEEDAAAASGQTPVTEEVLEEPTSLDIVTRYALEHSPAVRTAYFAWKAASERIVQQRAYENPMVTYSPDTGNTSETRAGALGHGVAISQAIPFPGKLTVRGRIADQEAQAARERLAAVIQEISRQVRARYADYYLAYRSLDINADTTELVRQFAAIADALYRVGTAAQQDVILAQEQLSRLAAERVIFDGDRATALGSLNALLDRPPRAPVGSPQGLHTDEIPAVLESLVEIANSARPELKEQDHFIEASEESLTFARMGYLPDFRIGAQYVNVKGGSNPGFRGDGNDIWAVSMGFSVPIWVDRIEAEIGEMDAKVMREKSRRRDLTNRVYDQVQRAYEQTRVFAHTETIYRATLIPQTQERIAAARAGYETGQVDFLTLIDSLKSLEEVQLERDRAVRGYQRALADLERAIGRPIDGIAEHAGDER